MHNDGMIYGYSRVSTDGQSVSAQVAELTPHQKKEAIARRERGKETLAEIGRSYAVSGWTISRLTA